LTLLRLHDICAGMPTIESYIEAGYLARQFHPELPYAILNYTNKTTYDRQWDSVTRQCRGLIYHTETEEIVARPFPKFFNYNEPGSPVVAEESKGDVYDKLDGSLGILYPTPDGWAVATRGSFTSDQAQWATEWWQQRYANFQPYRDRTYLFEIIYPENRIVLDYGMTQDLFLLDVLEIRTGRRMSDPEWPGPRAELLMDAITLEDALLLGDRTNAEGFVWVEWATGTRVKVKQEDYIRKHRIVHGLNARSVWQVLADPDYTDEKWYSFLMELPEELQAWAENVAEGLSKNFGRLRNAAYDAYNDIVAQLGPEYTRRDFAELAKTQYQYPSMLFSLLDGKSIDEYCWKLVYPPGDIRPQGTVTNEEGE